MILPSWQMRKGMQMKLLAKKEWFWIATFVLTLIASYSALGILQALSLFQGERVLVNLRLWGSIMLLSLFGASICIFLALRGRSRSKTKVVPTTRV